MLLPFAYDTFYEPIEKPAFSILTKRYNMPLREAQKIIDLGRLLCNDKVIKIKNQPICGEIKVLLFKPESKALAPIFKSENFMIFDKPSGILVHPKTVTTSYSLLDEIRAYGTSKSNPAHRIDKETSGLVVAGLMREDEIALKKMFEKKEIKKSYLAWVRGKIESFLVVDEPIKVRDDYSTSKHKVEISSSGKAAKTIFKRLYYDNVLDASLIEATPLTGRTHQIRVHLFHIKHPIVGDPIYGVPFEVASNYLDNILSQQDRVKYMGAKRLMLHANMLDFSFNNTRYIIKSRIDFYKNRELILKS